MHLHELESLKMKYDNVDMNSLEPKEKIQLDEVDHFVQAKSCTGNHFLYQDPRIILSYIYYYKKFNDLLWLYHTQNNAAS